MTLADEINFDGLVGPTHNYGGLSIGNLASMSNTGEVSNPRGAALQGLKKMRALMKMGLKQGVLPPHERPHLPALRAFGFSGSSADILAQAASTSPTLLANVSSAAAMWTANAATVSPSADTTDGKVHFTPANLGAMYHRSLEHTTTGLVLKRIFADEAAFVHHPAVTYGGAMGDEGAANHGRLAPDHGSAGVELFIYGRSAFERPNELYRFPPRQALEASQGIARKHQLDTSKTVFVQQSIAAVNAGAFHNDVVSVTNGTVLFYHQDAFEQTEAALDTITKACGPLGFEPAFIEVPRDAVSLEDAVASYLFNSQLVTLSDGTMAIILPTDAEENEATRRYVQSLVSGNGPVRSAHHFDLKQSMKNGGGPACLRLRVVLTEAEQNAVSTNCLLTEEKIDQLESWVTRHYRDRLGIKDLADPALLEEVYTALDELTALLSLGSVYDFQRV